MDIGRKGWGGNSISGISGSGEDRRYRRIWIYAAVIEKTSGFEATEDRKRRLIRGNDKNVARDNELYLPGFEFSLLRSNISAIAWVAQLTPYKLKRAVQEVEEEEEEDVSRLPAAHYIKCN